MNTQVIVYLTEPERARELGLPWTSEHSARWDYAHRHERGTAKAFVKLGRRIGCYPDIYHALLREQAA
jgi:hypothetical protein